MKYGLALGGGGTKGAYHIGVWQALMEMNIEVSAVTGTSIGSINGAIFAQGDWELAKEWWTSIDISDIIETSELGEVGDNILDIKNLKSVATAIYKNDGLEAAPLKNLLERLIDEDKVRNSKMEFGLVTYSLDKLEGEELFIEDIPKGKLVEFLMASASMPGLKKTVINEKKYIDGAVVNNIPSNMLINKGIKNIITVDVGGVGVVKGVETPGVNHIKIKFSENVIGHLDFSKEAIDKMIKMGYFDTLRAFSRIEGSIYAFNISDYHKSRIKYSEDIIYGIERAAEILCIDKYKLYRFDDLKNTVVNTLVREVNNYDSEETKPFFAEGIKIDERQLLVKFIKHIKNKKLDELSNKIFKGIMGEIYNAANAIVYFES